MKEMRHMDEVYGDGDVHAYERGESYEGEETYVRKEVHGSRL